MSEGVAITDICRLCLSIKDQDTSVLHLRITALIKQKFEELTSFEVS